MKNEKSHINNINAADQIRIDRKKIEEKADDDGGIAKAAPFQFLQNAKSAPSISLLLLVCVCIGKQFIQFKFKPQIPNT